MGLYDYNKVFQDFQKILDQNSIKAKQKKQQYLQRIVSIFTQFVKKCQKEIDAILNKKIDQLSQNYNKVKKYIQDQQKQSTINKEQKELMVAQFLIKPFERFPFSGNKNQKIFKEQYNLIQKASVLIQQTLIDSFNQDEVPTFSNNNFFKTIENFGLGAQSLTKLRLNPQNFRLSHIKDLNPVMTTAKSVKMIHSNSSLALIVGDSSNVQIWDLQKGFCLKQFYVEVKASINCFCKVVKKIRRKSIQSSQNSSVSSGSSYETEKKEEIKAIMNEPYKQVEMKEKTKQEQKKDIKEIPKQTPYQTYKQEFLVFGFGDQSPQIWSYRLDNFKRNAHNITHTRKVTKILQMSQSNYLLSGGADGNLCVHSFLPFKIKTLVQAPHVSPIQDIIQKNNYVYLLLKCSTVCQYQLNIINPTNTNLINNQNQLLHDFNQDVQINLQFRRTLSTGYISIIRFPQLTSNFAGVACHIYGLSQIQITRKFKLQQTNIINVVQMISDFIVVQSKQTSEYFAICVFQNSSTVRVYSLLSQEIVYELETQDYNQVGVAGYMPKIQVFYSEKKKCYIIVVVLQSQRPNQRNILRLYQLKI